MSGSAPRTVIVAAVIACVLAGAFVLVAPHRRPLPPGAQAPALTDAHAGIDLAALKGRPVLVDFFASWCQPCAVLAAPAVESVARAHPDLKVIGVALEREDTRPALPAFIAAHGVTWPVIVPDAGFDSGPVADWGVRGIPALFLVAPDGTIAASDLVGASSDETRANLERALAALPRH